MSHKLKGFKKLTNMSHIHAVCSSTTIAASQDNGMLGFLQSYLRVDNVGAAWALSQHYGNVSRDYVFFQLRLEQAYDDIAGGCQ